MRYVCLGRAAPAWAVLAALCLWTGASVAHPGGLNREGCHHDRKNGGYHCHRAGTTATPAPAPASSPAPRRELAPQRVQPDAARPAGRAFRNCDEVRAAGAAPVHRGDPGYGPHLDRDNDGIGCEPYRGR